jgi:hypothetical protein
MFDVEHRVNIDITTIISAAFCFLCYFLLGEGGGIQQNFCLRHELLLLLLLLLRYWYLMALRTSVHVAGINSVDGMVVMVVMVVTLHSCSLREPSQD